MYPSSSLQTAAKMSMKPILFCLVRIMQNTYCFLTSYCFCCCLPEPPILRNSLSHPSGSNRNHFSSGCSTDRNNKRQPETHSSGVSAESERSKEMMLLFSSAASEDYSCR